MIQNSNTNQHVSMDQRFHSADGRNQRFIFSPLQLSIFNALVITPLVLAFCSNVSHAQQQVAKVAVAKVVQREAESGQTFVATVQPLKRAVVGSAVAGRVEKRMFEVGDRVEALEPLMQLLTQTISIELKAAKAELALRTHEFTEMENGPRSQELEMAKARMMAAKARVEFDRVDFQRMTDLRRNNAIPEGELNAAQSTYEQSEQTYYELKSAYELSVEGSRVEKIAQTKAMVALQQARVEQIESRIRKYTIMSRFPGYVTAQHVDIGAWVKVGDPIVDVIELDQVEMRAQVPEQYISSIHSGLEVRVEVPAFPGRSFFGKVTAVIPQGHALTHTYPVIIRVKNEIDTKGPLLKAGMQARVELPTGRRQLATLIPKDALVLGGKEVLVYVVKENKSVPVPVELGIAVDNLIQVKGNIAAEDQVIVEGNERVRPGQEVSIVERVLIGQGN